MRIDRRRMHEKRNKKLLTQIGRLYAECLECSNTKIQNAISILSNTINNISIQKLKAHSTFHVATITLSVPIELQSPAIVTLTLNDVLKSIKQFTQALLTMRVTIRVNCAASQ